MCESGTLRPRPLSSTEIERRDSSGLDSGVGSPLVLTRRSSGISLAMKRSGSDSLQSMRSNTQDGNNYNIGEQTHLLLQKMLVLEKKVLSMESQLKEEQLQRLHLEAKVVKLEEENQELKQSRGLASKQLQEFADRFYAATESTKIGSLSASPHPSVSELRMSATPSRRDSMSSVGSLYSRDSIGSRYSGISIS